MPDRLTERQLQCLRLSATMTDKDIARRLGLSHHTVSLHIREAMRRLGASSRKAALREIAENPLYASDAIPERPAAPSPRPASGDQADERTTTPGATDRGWFLPPPPTPVVRLGVILAFAAVAALITVGIVQAISGALSALEPHAPPAASRTR